MALTIVIIVAAIIISALAIYLVDALNRVWFLERAIRKHRDFRGDDRCWEDDDWLYQSLPEGWTPPKRDSAVEIENCKRFIACRHNPNTIYVSPQRRIEELEAQLKYPRLSS